MASNEDAARYSIPSVHVVDDEKMQGTYQEPIAPGGSMPQLGLAGEDFNVASGQAFQAQPEPIKPDIVWPTISGSPECGGVDPANSSPSAPDLAGCGGGLISPASSAILPDYGQPDWASLNKPLQPYDLDAGMNYAPGGEWGADPDVPDLTSYNHPMGLDFHQSSPSDLFKPDPYQNDLFDYDQVQGVTFLRSPLDPDPQLPDLQNPQLEPEVRMEGRPGDMDDDALDVMHQAATYDQVKGVGYDVSFMTQPGSTSRSRHMDGLMHGLDGDR